MKKTKTLLIALALGFAMNAYAQDTPSWVVRFSNDGGTTWTDYGYQTSYDFTVEDGQKGILRFNSEIGSDVTVQGDFTLNGADFEIQTNGGQTITFEQPLSNYGTDIVVSGGGTIKTEGDAAFKSITIQSGEVVFGSRVGVTDKFSIESGGSATIEQDSIMLFTQRIHNNGTLHIEGVIDASNISRSEAELLLIQLENKLGQHGLLGTVPNGYIYGDNQTTWNIFDGESSGTCTSTSGKLMIGTAVFGIGEGGTVHNSQTQYQMWLQNAGSESVVSVLDARKVQEIEGVCDFMVRGGSKEQRTQLEVDMQLYDKSTVYVARNAVATILLPDGYDMGAIAKFKALDGADVQIHSFEGVSGRMNEATFIGQGIQVTAIAKYDPADLDFSPYVLTVENASSVRISANVHCSGGYFNGTDAKMEQLRHSGDYVVNGALTIASGFTLDMTVSPDETSDNSTFASGTYESHTAGATVTNVTFSEEFGHLTIAEEGRVVVEEGASFKANTVRDDEDILDEKGNLDTSRTSASTTFDNWLNPICNGNVKYTLNGTMDVAGKKGGAIITAADGAEHYTTRNKLFTIANANIVVSDAFKSNREGKIGTGDTTISNVLIGDSVTNNKANNGTVTLDNTASDNYDTLYAKDGDIAITNRQNVNAETVHLGAGREVSVSTLPASTPAQLLRDGSLTVTTMLKADGGANQENYSKIGADLNLVAGSELDVSAAGGVGGIEMLNNTVTLKSGTSGSGGWTLSETDYNQLWAMEKGGKYDLFFDVSAFDYGEGAKTTAIEPETLDASMYFTNFKEGWFYLCYSGANEQGGNGGNVGTIYLYSMVPEPTTGTLSLLALAGLCLRRRRK